MGIDVLRSALDELAGEDLTSIESVVGLFAEMSRLQSIVVGAVHGFDVSRQWAPSGAKSAASYLAGETRYPAADCRRSVRLGRELSDLPAVSEAFSRGSIGTAQALALTGAANDRTRKTLREDEELLVGQAETLGYEIFTRALCYWEQMADPDGTDERSQAKQGRRDVSLSQSLGGMFYGKMTLDPISGQIVADELDRIETELFESDWRDAGQALGHEPTARDLARTPAQRRADALVEMATRSRTTPAGGQRPRPLFTILVGYETLAGRICESESGTVVAPASLLGHLDEADFERVVFAPADRVDVSVRSRLFTGATRRAIQVRDRRCYHPYCKEPISRCQADHIVPFADGGETTQQNGRLACGFHNRLRNKERAPA